MNLQGMRASTRLCAANESSLYRLVNRIKMYANALKQAVEVAHRNLALMSVLALSAGVSINTLTNSFAYDDSWMFVNNQAIHSLRNVPRFFLSNPWTPSDLVGETFVYYRPAIAVFHTLEFYFFGKNPLPYHLVNAILHVLISGLVFVFIRRMVQEPKIALLASLLFAVHPVHSESVAWISGVSDLLTAFFSLLACIAYLNFQRDRLWRWIPVIAALFSIALLSKETAIVLFLVLPLLEIFSPAGTATDRRSKAIRLAAVWAAFMFATIIYLIFRLYSNGGLATGIARRSVSTILLSLPGVIVYYLKLLVYPFGYSIHHRAEIVASVSLENFILPLFFIGSVVFLLIFRGTKTLAFSMAWFVVWLLPALIALRTFAAPIYLVQDRYLYLSSLGFCLLVAVIAFEVYQRFGKGDQSRRGLKIGYGLILLVLAVQHIDQNAVWKDTITLFEHNAEINRESHAAFETLASGLLSEKIISQAEKASEESIRLAPQELSVYMTAALIAERKKDYLRGVQLLEKAIQVGGSDYDGTRKLSDVFFLLGQNYQKQNDLRQAEENYNKAIAVHNNNLAWDALSLLYFELGEYPRALAALEELKSNLPPTSGYADLKMGRFHETLNQREDAVRAYRSYLVLAPFGKYYKDTQRRIAELSRDE